MRPAVAVVGHARSAPRPRPPRHPETRPNESLPRPPSDVAHVDRPPAGDVVEPLAVGVLGRQRDRPAIARLRSRASSVAGALGERDVGVGQRAISWSKAAATRIAQTAGRRTCGPSSRTIQVRARVRAGDDRRPQLAADRPGRLAPADVHADPGAEVEPGGVAVDERQRGRAVRARPRAARRCGRRRGTTATVSRSPSVRRSRGQHAAARGQPHRVVAGAAGHDAQRAAQLVDDLLAEAGRRGQRRSPPR